MNATKKAVERGVVHQAVELGQKWPNVSFSVAAMASLSMTFPFVASICLVILLIRLLRMPEGEMQRKREDSSQKIVSLPTCETHYEFVQGKEKVVVFVHGCSGDSSHVFPLAEHVHKETGFSVLVYDLVGRGFSSCRGQPHEVSLFVSQLTELLLALEIQLPIHLVGISMGGGIVAEFARIFPKAVASVSLVASAGLRLSTGVHIFTKIPILPDILFRFALRSTVVAGLEHEWSKPHGSPHFYKMLQSYEDRVAHEPSLGRSLLSTWRFFPFEGLEHAFKALSSNQKPVLCIWGDSDGTCPIDAAYDLVNRIVPHADLLVVKGARHCVYSEFSSTVAQNLALFIRKRAQQEKQSNDNPTPLPRVRFLSPSLYEKNNNHHHTNEENKNINKQVMTPPSSNILDSGTEDLLIAAGRTVLGLSH